MTPRHARSLVLLLGTVLVASLFAALFLRTGASSINKPSIPYYDRIAYLTIPRRVEIQSVEGGAVNLNEIAFFIDTIGEWARIKGSSSPAIAVHLARLAGVLNQCPLLQDQTVVLFRESVEAITNDSKLSDGGFPIIIETNNGIAYRNSSGTNHLRSRQFNGFPHRDNAAAELGEMGLSINTSVETYGGLARSLRHVLAESVSNVHPSSELEWTLIAYSCYLDTFSWRTAVDDVVTLDDLVIALLQKPYERSPCLGTHKFYTLAFLYNVDQTHGLLGDKAAGLVKEEVIRVCRRLRSSQLPNGAWDSTWLGDTSADSAPPLSRGYAGECLRATGHILEALILIEQSIRPNDRQLLRATDYLMNALRGESSYSDFLTESTHAVRALVLLASDTSLHNRKVILNEFIPD